jgi:outer membrane protein
MKRTLITLAVLATLSGKAAADDLQEVWQAAQGHDPQYLAAQSDKSAGDARRDLGGTLFKPSVSLVGSASLIRQNTSMTGAQFSQPMLGTYNNASFNTSINSGTHARLALQAVMPLYDRELSAQKQQLDLSADVANSGMVAADQSLILRVSERYFAALKMKETLKLLGEQERAVADTYAEISRRQQLGDASRIDQRATAEEVEAVKVKLLDTELAYQNDLLALAELTGKMVQVDPLSEHFDAKAIVLGEASTWVSKAKQNSQQLKMLALQEQVKRTETDRYDSAFSPKLNLVAQAERQHASGNGDFGAASNSATNGMLGVQLTVPLTDSNRSARKEESYYLAETSHQDYLRAGLEIEKQVNSLWFAINAGKARVESLGRMVELSRERLDATQRAHRQGSRTTLELLGAQSAHISARLQLLEEQIDLIVNRMRLAAIAGEISEDDLKQANRFIAHS